MNLNIPTAKWWHELVSPGTHQVTEAKQTQLTKAWLRGLPVNRGQEQMRAHRTLGLELRTRSNSNASYSTAWKLWGRNQLENQA